MNHPTHPSIVKAYNQIQSCSGEQVGLMARMSDFGLRGPGFETPPGVGQVSNSHGTDLD